MKILTRSDGDRQIEVMGTISEAFRFVDLFAGLGGRFKRIRYRAVTPEGEAIDRTVEGFHARVVQHECDHLDGILYPERMTDHRLLSFLEEWQRYPMDIAPAQKAAE